MTRWDDVDGKMQAEDTAHDYRQAGGISPRAHQLGASARRNGGESVGSPVFTQQIGAMLELSNRLNSVAHRVREAVDLVSGPEPEKDSDPRVSPNPVTVEQTWHDVMAALNKLEYQVSRLYR